MPQLTRGKVLLLRDAVVAKTSLLCNTGPLMKSAARILSDDLGFVVSGRQVRTVCEQLGIKWEVKEKRKRRESPKQTLIPFGKNNKTDILGRIDAIMEELTALRKDVVDCRFRYINDSRQMPLN